MAFSGARFRRLIGDSIYSVLQHFRILFGRGEKLLYAGDIVNKHLYPKRIGLSLERRNRNHLKCDITRLPLPFWSNSIDIFQAEDVFEHIDYDLLPGVVSEIFRVLKPGGVFRLSVPDYRSPLLLERSVFDSGGKLQFDPGGGGQFDGQRVIGGGHVWFPKVEDVKALFHNSPFSKVDFLHFYDTDGSLVLRDIDYRFGNVSRTPDFDPRVQNPRRPLSIVVDAVK